jgi:hypothetical protein
MEDGQTKKVPEMEIRDQLRDTTMSKQSSGQLEKYDPLQQAKWNIGAVRDQAQSLLRK